MYIGKMAVLIVVEHKVWGGETLMQNKKKQTNKQTEDLSTCLTNSDSAEANGKASIGVQVQSQTNSFSFTLCEDLLQWKF